MSDPYPDLCIYPKCVGLPKDKGCPCVTGKPLNGVKAPRPRPVRKALTRLAYG